MFWKNNTESVKKSSRTSALWVQYMRMIDILCKFIRAEHTGNWELHLQSDQAMLPYIHGSFWPQILHQIWHAVFVADVKPPDSTSRCSALSEGFYVICRSNRLWAGLSSDLVIEQVLIRSFKTSGGLTLGHGMTENQRLLWLLSRPACAEVIRQCSSSLGLTTTLGEQNKDVSSKTSM